MAVGNLSQLQLSVTSPTLGFVHLLLPHVKPQTMSYKAVILSMWESTKPPRTDG